MLKGSKLKYISFKFRIVIDIEEYSEKLWLKNQVLKPF